MEKTVRDYVLEALNELESGSLKSFRNKLTDCKVKEGYRRILKGQLENKDPEDITKLILQYYEESYGVELTLSVLRAINENQVAADLAKCLANVDGFTWEKKPKEEPPSTSEVKKEAQEGMTSEASSSSAPKPQEKHFVDKHEEALIAKCALVGPILDGLKSKDLLIDEQIDTIRAERTSQEKMRVLYMNIRGFSDSEKDILYEILKKNNGPLIRNLEKS